MTTYMYVCLRDFVDLLRGVCEGFPRNFRIRRPLTPLLGESYHFQIPSNAPDWSASLSASSIRRTPDL